MSAKDYIAIARVLSKHRDSIIFSWGADNWNDLVEDFVAILLSDNERFNTKLFKRAVNEL